MRTYITKNVLIVIMTPLLLSMGVGYSQRTLKNDDGLWYREQKIAVAEYSEIMTTIGGTIFLGKDETKEGNLLAYWIEIEHRTPLYDEFGFEIEQSDVFALDFNNIRLHVDEDARKFRNQVSEKKQSFYKETIRITLSSDLFDEIVSEEDWGGYIYTNGGKDRIVLWIFDMHLIEYQARQLQ